MTLLLLSVALIPLLGKCCGASTGSCDIQCSCIGASSLALSLALFIDARSVSDVNVSLHLLTALFTVYHHHHHQQQQLQQQCSALQL